jgi:hypothetical protein
MFDRWVSNLVFFYRLTSTFLRIKQNQHFFVIEFFLNAIVLGMDVQRTGQQVGLSYGIDLFQDKYTGLFIQSRTQTNREFVKIDINFSPSIKHQLATNVQV